MNSSHLDGIAIRNFERNVRCNVVFVEEIGFEYFSHCVEKTKQDEVNAFDFTVGQPIIPET